VDSRDKKTTDGTEQAESSSDSCTAVGGQQVPLPADRAGRGGEPVPRPGWARRRARPVSATSGAGIRQSVDIGAGIPTVGNTRKPGGVVVLGAVVVLH